MLGFFAAPKPMEKCTHLSPTWSMGSSTTSHFQKSQTDSPKESPVTISLHIWCNRTQTGQTLSLIWAEIRNGLILAILSLVLFPGGGSPTHGFLQRQSWDWWDCPLAPASSSHCLHSPLPPPKILTDPHTPMPVLQFVLNPWSPYCNLNPPSISSLGAL